MSEAESDKRDVVEQEFDLNQPPQKVWRAISLPEFRESWLPTDALAELEPTILEPGQSVSYRMRERTAPFLESTVTFEIASNGSGGTCLRILHELTDEGARRVRQAANSNVPLMLAA